MRTELQEKIEYYVLNGDFEATKALMQTNDFMMFEEAFVSACHESESVMYYTFILECMKEDETVELHDLAFLLLVYPLSEVNGAFQSAYYHAVRSVEMTDKMEVKSLLQLLFLYAVPEPVISDKEAFDTAKQILKLEPKHQVARNILKQSAKKLDKVVVDFNQITKKA
ncbi:hypothetical protein [Macrococcoides caseolyticum]|uniref:hypothetical protein n=1 Tax=Macrococcoides caseolyticum TaxID=69966 RepID=UPI001F46F465|nr:hypothetical protein [Macrococcus caseolyticus]MCE4955968.1 hypothetical protein [Macrococcus caseolyticus]